MPPIGEVLVWDREPKKAAAMFRKRASALRRCRNVALAA